MDNDKIETLLLKLVEDLAYVKARLEVMESVHEDYKEISAKVEKLEMQNERHEKQIQSVEHRACAMEQFMRDNMNAEKTGGWRALGAIGICVVTAVLSLVINLLN